MRLDWCEEHRMPMVGVIDGGAICREVLNYRRANDPGCRMVEMLLVEKIEAERIIAREIAGYHMTVGDAVDAAGVVVEALALYAEEGP